MLQLLHGLQKAPAQHDYLLVAAQQPGLLEQATDLLKDPRFSLHLLAEKSSTRMWRERFTPRFAARNGVDLWHSHVQAIPILLDRPKVATMHELSWMDTDEVGDEGWVSRRRALAWVVARAADRIVCASEHTRNNFIALHPKASARTRVIQHGVDPKFFATKTSARQDLLHQLGLKADARLLLCVGRPFKRKGLPRAIRAFQAFINQQQCQHFLVIAGVHNQQMAAALALATELGIGPQVLAPGHVPDETLVALYANADALLVPSESEGFGLPILEAMAAGLPVVANNCTAIPEVAGDAAVLCSFESAQNTATAIGEALRQADKLRVKGIARAEEFPLAAPAHQLLALWEELVS